MPREESLNEAFELVSKGWLLKGPYRHRKGRWRIILTDPEGGGQKTVTFGSEEEAQKVYEALSKVAEDVKPAGRPGGAWSRDERLWWLKLEAQKPLLKSVIEKVSWLQDAIMDIGFAALLTTFQYMKIEPREWGEKLEKYESKEAFVRDVLQYFGALIEAAREAGRIMELEEELRIEQAKRTFAEYLVEQVKRERDNALAAYRMALACMCEKDLRRFSMQQLMANIGVSLLKQQAREEVKKEVAGGAP